MTNTDNKTTQDKNVVNEGGYFHPENKPILTNTVTPFYPMVACYFPDFTIENNTPNYTGYYVYAWLISDEYGSKSWYRNSGERYKYDGKDFILCECDEDDEDDMIDDFCEEICEEAYQNQLLSLSISLEEMIERIETEDKLKKMIDLKLSRYHESLQETNLENITEQEDDEQSHDETQSLCENTISPDKEDVEYLLNTLNNSKTLKFLKKEFTKENYFHDENVDYCYAICAICFISHALIFNEYKETEYNKMLPVVCTSFKANPNRDFNKPFQRNLDKPFQLFFKSSFVNKNNFDTRDTILHILPVVKNILEKMLHENYKLPLKDIEDLINSKITSYETSIVHTIFLKDIFKNVMKKYSGEDLSEYKSIVIDSLYESYDDLDRNELLILSTMTELYKMQRDENFDPYPCKFS